MDKPLVSIIVPVYNVEKYLAECLDSLINQTFREIEIIVVNDGSTDGSRDIVERYCFDDARVRLIDRENRGQGAARNAGLFYARGKYVLFADSDDYLDTGAVEVLCNKAEELQTDILVYNGKAFSDGDKSFEKKLYFALGKRDEGAVVSGLEFAARHNAIASPCLKLFSKEFLTQNELTFPEGFLGEDMEFNWRSMIAAERVTYTHYVGYCRRCRAGSTMTGGSIANIEGRIKSFHRLADLLITEGEIAGQARNDDLIKALASKIAMYACGLWVVAMSIKDKAAREKLVPDFYGYGIDGFIRRHRRGFFQRCASILIAMPRVFNPLKRLACVTVRKVFRGKTELFV